MIPITASIVGGQAVGAARPSKRRAVALTFAYVLGLALVYAALGLLAGMTGSMFGTVSTNPWLHLLIANLLILAALAMLDVDRKSTRLNSSHGYISYAVFCF